MTAGTGRRKRTDWNTAVFIVITNHTSPVQQIILANLAQMHKTTTIKTKN